ncbi:hypothetical protein FRC10_003421 [Ceratobasidium sp. 414]|nr:hypothetical protein FRC10_003421 [Ceratobasidium sp. 414]
MTGVTSSNRQIPFDIVIAILNSALAAPVSAPPSPADRQLRASVLSLNHEIRGTFIKQLYNTVVLWSMDSLRGFFNTLESSPCLGSLVLSLWVGNKDVTAKRVLEPGFQVVKNGYEDVAFYLGRILAKTPNLQRLFVAIVAEHGCAASFPIPKSVRHLALPSMWVIRTVVGGTLQDTPIVLSNLESLRIRGLLTFDHPPFINRCPLNIRRVIVEMTRPEEFDIIAIIVLAMLLCPPISRTDVQVVVSPSSPEIQSTLSRRDFADYGGVTLVEQSLDDPSQLGIWLSEGEPSRFGAF